MVANPDPKPKIEMARPIPPPKSGIKGVTPDYRLTIEGWEYAVARMPKKKCKHTGCHGRGYAGIHGTTKQPILCQCVGYWELLNVPEATTSDTKTT
jgi:hypothetical protein